MHRASHMWRAVNAEKFRRRVSHKECRKAAWRRGPTDSLSYFCDQTLPLLWRATQPPNQKSAPTPCPQGQLRNRTPATVGSPPPGGPTRPSHDGPSTSRTGRPRPCRTKAPGKHRHVGTSGRGKGAAPGALRGARRRRVCGSLAAESRRTKAERARGPPGDPLCT